MAIRLALLLSLALIMGGCYGSIMYDMLHPNRPYDARIDGPLGLPHADVPPPPMPTRGIMLCTPSGRMIVCY